MLLFDMVSECFGAEKWRVLTSKNLAAISVNVRNLMLRALLR